MINVKMTARFNGALIVSALGLGLFTTSALAKSGIIVKGENGTKWCCGDGVKGDTCEKGASSIPSGANCNFASRTVPIQPLEAGAPAAEQQINKSKSNVKNN